MYALISMSTLDNNKKASLAILSHSVGKSWLNRYSK